MTTNPITDLLRAETEIEDLRRQLAQAQSAGDRSNTLRRELDKLKSLRAADTQLLESIAAIHPQDTKIPKWMSAKPSRKIHHATPVLMLSDLHLDEVVDLRDMHGMNEYNRGIAEARLGRTIDFAAEYLKQYTAGVHIDGLVITLLGDIVTGVIHDELARTNVAPVPETIAHWVPLLASAFQHLADSFEHVHIPCVDGNHDRTYAKIPMKQRATSSYAWIIYNWLADTLRADDRITFSISASSDQIIDIYTTKFLLQHGDGFRSAGGVGGIYPSLLKYLHRQRAMWAASRQHWDYCLMGHWHSLMWGQDFIINGSMKGYDEYARRSGFGFELARQALFIVTPERGITTQTAVYCD